MSAENFIKFFKDKRKSSDFNDVSDYADYQGWVSKNNTWFNKNRDDLEKMGLSKTVGFVVSMDKADELGVRDAFDQLASKFEGNSDIGKPVVDIVDGKTVILFSNVPFKDGIERTLDKYFGMGTSSKAKEMGMVKGHIYGFMTGAVLGARDELYNFLTNDKNEVTPIMSKDEADHALNFLDTLITHLQKLDIDSAELKTLTSDVFLKYNKSATNFLIELQSKTDNDASAKLVQKLSGKKNGATGIRALINPQSTQQQALAGIMDVLLKDGTFTTNEILDFRSSPTLKELIVDEVMTAFGKDRKLPKEIKSPLIELPNKIVTAYVSEQAKAKYKQDIQKTIADARANKQKIIQQQQNIENTKKLVVSSASLLNLLNTHLQDVVSANMGNGSDKNILNYRTGRFASSVKVERLSISREGMITAFYDYMRNPYATFSEGGKQQNPRSRDPKLLIAKSIREIAATKVANRMRAVLV
jgi:hypothetical protein